MLLCVMYLYVNSEFIMRVISVRQVEAMDSVACLNAVTKALLKHVLSNHKSWPPFFASPELRNQK